MGTAMCVGKCKENVYERRRQQERSGGGGVAPPSLLRGIVSIRSGPGEAAEVGADLPYILR